MRWRSLIIPLLLTLTVAVSAALYLRRQGEGRDTKKNTRGSVAGVLGGDSKGFLRATSVRRFAFPLDHGPHPGYRNEWWYFTGNLRSQTGRRFGYQLTFFRFALKARPETRPSRWAANDIYMAHFALTDVSGKEFYSWERFSRAALGLAGAGGNPLEIHVENWNALESSAVPFGVTLSAAEAKVGLTLRLRALKPVVPNGNSGLSQKGGGAGNASYYYSIPRLATSGSIRIGDESLAVDGLSWLDREWSTSSLDPDQVGWDWFSIQLDDGRDLMFYRLRERNGSASRYSSGTVVEKDGSYHPVTLQQVTAEPVSFWKSPHSGVLYPQVWRLRIASEHLDLELVPRLPDQELQGSFRYWEGAVAVRGLSGSPDGTGYLEMTGY